MFFRKTHKKVKRLRQIGTAFVYVLLLFLGNGVVMNGSIRKRIVATSANLNCRPFLLGAGIVHVGQTGTAEERRIANARDAVGDRDACQSGTAFERILANARDAASTHQDDTDEVAGRRGRRPLQKMRLPKR